MSTLHFGHLNRLFRDGRHISHLDSKIVNTSQVTPEGSECTAGRGWGGQGAL